MSTTTAPHRAILRRPRLPRLTGRRLAVIVALALAVFIAWMWFRSSSLVSVRQVSVSGLSGQNVGAIRTDLIQEARTMTTLDISTAKLQSAISGYGHIAGVTVSTDFPHRVAIHVDETIPVATIRTGAGAVAVDGAGLLLPRVPVSGLPALSAAPLPSGPHVSSGGTRSVLTTLAAAPYQLLSHILSARSTAADGVIITLRNGPQVVFGATSQLALKWKAADAVLASPSSAGASYIDVSVPTRPTAGVGTPG